ncbi:MAG: thioredoxin [Muribaculaceae bacterium]
MNKFEELVQADVPVLVDFFATWCGPCQALAPVLEELHAEMGDRVKIIKIDIDENEALAAAMKVRSVPTLMIYKDGEQKWRGVGLHSRSDLKALLEQYGA